MRTFCFAVYKALSAAAAKLAEILGQKKLGRFSADLIRKPAGDIAGGAFVALTVDYNGFQLDQCLFQFRNNLRSMYLQLSKQTLF